MKLPNWFRKLDTALPTPVQVALVVIIWIVVLLAIRYARGMP